MSLVAGYDSSSESEIESKTNDDDSSENDSEEVSDEKESSFLPLPKSLTAKKVDKDARKLNTNSVYSNPYYKQQSDSLKVLSKHTNLSAIEILKKDKQKKKKFEQKKKQKLCTHYFKHGTCKYENECKFLHSLREVESESPGGSAIVTSVVPSLAKEASISKKLIKKSNQVQNVNYINNEIEIPAEVDDDWDGETKLRKKRPGLSDTIVPSKKALKMYRENPKNINI